MLHFYRELIKVRRTQPDVASGDLRATSMRFDEDAEWIIMSRGSVHVVANLAGRAQVVPFHGEVEHVLASWGRAPIVDSQGVGLDGHDVAVLRTTV
jgi:maltooligosyltrehalose trehalohydrolase